MSEIIHWEQMEEFTTVTALRLMARDTLANFAWDHWMKCKQVERLLAQYNDACALLLEKNQTITDLRNADAQEPQRQNGVLQGTVQHLKEQLTVVEVELGKAHAVIKRLREDNAELYEALIQRGVEE